MISTIEKSKWPLRLLLYYAFITIIVKTSKNFDVTIFLNILNN